MTNNRKNTLNNANIDTTKFFSLTLPEGLKAGSKITLTITEDGTPVFVDEIEKQIKENGYVPNRRLFRRWVMAQMFRMLNYKCGDGKGGYDAYLNHFHDYKYQFDVMLDEMHALAKMEMEGGKDFEIRKSFFTKEVVIATCDDYCRKLDSYLFKRPRVCIHGRFHIKVSGRNIPISDIRSDFIFPLRTIIGEFEHVHNYKEMEMVLQCFVNHMIKLPFDTPKCSEWKSAFKGAGAYYTLQNLIRFHGVRVYVGGSLCKVPLNMAASEDYLEKKRLETTGAGYKLFAFMKEVINDNNFDFNRRMNELYR